MGNKKTSFKEVVEKELNKNNEAQVYANQDFTIITGEYFTILSTIYSILENIKEEFGEPALKMIISEVNKDVE